MAVSLMHSMACRAVTNHASRFLSTSAALKDKELYLGLDLSTQGLKATLVNEKEEIVTNTALNFESDLSHYGTSGGFYAEGDVVTAPALMFTEALDIILGRLKDKAQLDKVKAISGSGQQHGSVYFQSGASQTLANLTPGKSIKEQMKDAFSIAAGPIWRDSSTTAQCRALEAAVGGAEELANITGSRAYERFTGNQIAKIAQNEPDVYNNTERISLISSFMCSLILGQYASIDSSDGAGMNMMDLSTQQWSDKVLQHIAPGLGDKLGDVVPAHTVLGNVSSYMNKEFGFAEDCKVVAWSGDNPCSVAGLGLRNPGDIGISLGTSDTLFAIVDATKSKRALQGHTFMNPVDPQSHMSMLCYKNGSLAREKVLEDILGLDGNDWDGYNNLMAQTKPGNDGYSGCYVFDHEIVPDIPVTGIRRFDPNVQMIDSFSSKSMDARACIEWQMIRMRFHSASLGVTPNKIVVTGGASVNKGITQIMADVFGVPVEAAAQADSASLGAALRAKHGYQCHEDGFVKYEDATANCPALQHNTVAEPDFEAHQVYTKNLLITYEQAEEIVLKSI